MAKPSVSMPDELKEELDNEILRLKADKKLPDEGVRSRVITELIRDWLETEDTAAWAEKHGLSPEQEADSGNRIVPMAD